MTDESSKQTAGARKKPAPVGTRDPSPEVARAVRQVVVRAGRFGAGPEDLRPVVALYGQAAVARAVRGLRGHIRFEKTRGRIHLAKEAQDDMWTQALLSSLYGASFGPGGFGPKASQDDGDEANGARERGVEDEDDADGEDDGDEDARVQGDGKGRR